MERKQILRIVLTALFAALIAAGAFIRIPLVPAPMTLQTLFLLIAALCLPFRLAVASTAAYLFLGAVGLPDRVPDHVSLHGLLIRIRLEFDQYICLRPGYLLPGVKSPLEGKKSGDIDFVIVRENTEGEYSGAGGRCHPGTPFELALETSVFTKTGVERTIRYAFNLAQSRRKHLICVTKSNAQRHTLTLWDECFERVAREFPDVRTERMLVDAMAAKMMDPEFNKGIEVIVLPNLYGDIVTDVAAEAQGGLGTASSSNLGDHYAMFEAIHGTAPYLMSHGRGEYADPSSLIRAVGMMLGYIGYVDRKKKLEEAMEVCTVLERKVVITTMPEDASTEQFTDYVIETLEEMK